MQSYWEITSDTYLDYIKQYVVGIGPWKDTIVPVMNNYAMTPSDLVSRAHARNLQVHFFVQTMFSFIYVNNYYMNLFIFERSCQSIHDFVVLHVL